MTMRQIFPAPGSKLSVSGDSIFSQMTALAYQYQAINLSQGFPDFNGPEYLQQRLAWHVSQGANQYAPMIGVESLRAAIAAKTTSLYGHSPNVKSDITVTTGATEALYASITALVCSGDEVICFDPAYDSYAPAVALAGGIIKRIFLQPPEFQINWQQFASLLSPLTRLIIINTPHNTSATVWQTSDSPALWQAIAQSETYVLSDEVYEHICFTADGHVGVLALPHLRERAIVVSSFGKTFHMTGWKVGYSIAPALLSTEIRHVHQYLTFSVNTPAQLALADMLREQPAHYRELADFYRSRSDLFTQSLANSRLQLLPCHSPYFLLADYSDVSDLDDVDFCHWLTIHVGVAAIPVSVFSATPFPHKFTRLCLAKQDSTLDAAAERLCQL